MIGSGGKKRVVLGRDSLGLDTGYKELYVCVWGVGGGVGGREEEEGEEGDADGFLAKSHTYDTTV